MLTYQRVNLHFPMVFLRSECFKQLDQRVARVLHHLCGTSPSKCLPSLEIAIQTGNVPSGKHTKNNGKSPDFMGKSTISMAIFNSKLLVYYPHMVALPSGNNSHSYGKWP